MAEKANRKNNEEITEKALSLKNLINYQSKSIVSKVIVSKKNGNITLFAFDEDEGLSEHTVPFDALVYCIEGKAQVNISNKINTVQEGDIIIMPANKCHSIKAITKFKMLLIMIKEDGSEITSYH